MLNEIKRIVSPALHAPADQKIKANIAYTLLHQQYLQATLKQGKCNSSTVEECHFWLECFGYIIALSDPEGISINKKNAVFDSQYEDVERLTVKPMTPSALSFYLNQLPI